MSVLINVPASPHYREVIVISVEHAEGRVVIDKSEKVWQQERGNNFISNVENSAIFAILKLELPSESLSAIRSESKFDSNW